MRNWSVVVLLFAFWSSVRLLASAADYPVTNILNSLDEAPLRAALASAEASGIPTKITYQDSGSISLTAPLVLQSNVWVDLPGTVITTGGPAGAFLVRSNANARISGLIISNVITRTNAAVLNEGTLLIENCVLDSNSSLIGKGGAIHNRGNLTIKQSRITRNASYGESQFWGSPSFGSRTGAGGGIQQERGTLTLYDSTVQSNKTYVGFIASFIPEDMVADYGGSVGAGICVVTGTAVINRTAIADNYTDHGQRSRGDGAGIYIVDGEVLATNCTILRNRAAGAPGRVNAFGASVPGYDAAGGGLAAVGGKVVLTHCTIAENSSRGGALAQFSQAGTGHGGGIYVSAAQVGLRACIVIANEAEEGKDLSGTITNSSGNILGRDNTATELTPSSVIKFPASISPTGT